MKDMEDMTLLGLHHVTAMTHDVHQNYRFFTEVLGMRLVKKTVNQDDIHTYHTFYADDVGTPGTDVTFFDFPQSVAGRAGADSLYRTSFRVPSDASLLYWQERLASFGVKTSEIETRFGSKVLLFEEEDGQRYQLISDEDNKGVAGGIPWQAGPVPKEHAIYGLGPIEIHMRHKQVFQEWLEKLFGFRVIVEENERTLLEVGEGGHGGQIHLVENQTDTTSRQGDGEIHHVAFRVKNREALNQWQQRLEASGLRHSGYVNRFYFESLYVRVGPILIELATDEPGFMGDEPYETLGESLSLPPFLEAKRDYIESVIKPFDTQR